MHCHFSDFTMKYLLILCIVIVMNKKKLKMRERERERPVSSCGRDAKSSSTYSRACYCARENSLLLQPAPLYSHKPHHLNFFSLCIHSFSEHPLLHYYVKVGLHVVTDAVFIYYKKNLLFCLFVAFNSNLYYHSPVIK